MSLFREAHKDLITGRGYLLGIDGKKCVVKGACRRGEVGDRWRGGTR